MQLIYLGLGVSGKTSSPPQCRRHWRHAAVPPPMPWPPLPHAALPGPPLHGQGRPRCPTLPLSLPPPLLPPFPSVRVAAVAAAFSLKSPATEATPSASKPPPSSASSSSAAPCEESLREARTRRRRPGLPRLRLRHGEHRAVISGLPRPRRPLQGLAGEPLVLPDHLSIPLALRSVLSP